jgi:pyridoxamine 5'-phosphate oxidase family protein
MTFQDFELQYLSSQPLGRLATVQPDGTLQVSPVGYAYNAELDTIDIGGYNMTSSRKYRNVADNGRVAFVIDDIRSHDPWRVRCLEIRGTAEVVPEQALIRIRPKRVISFGIDDADSEPHEMTSHARDVG